MLKLINPNNYPIPVGEGLGMVVVPAFGTRTVMIKIKSVPEGLVAQDIPVAAPVQQKPLQGKTSTLGGK